MTNKIKPLGVIERFNEVDIDQIRHFVRIHNTAYFTKMPIDMKPPDFSTHTSNLYAPGLII